MSAEITDLIQSFYQNVDVLLLILIRLLGFFIILPVLTASSIPMEAKVGLSFFMAHLVFLSGVVSDIPYDPTLSEYVILLIQEFLVGFILGYVVYIIFSILYMAGQFVDAQIGFSMVSIFDPVSQIQVPITGNLFYFVMCAFLIQTGGLHRLIYAVFYSYEVIPPGQAVIIHNEGLLNRLLQIVIYFLETGVRVALPIMGPIFILDVAMGLLVKTVPQMNIFVVGIPLKLLAGLILLFVLVPVFTGTYDFLFDQAYKELFNMMEELMP